MEHPLWRPSIGYTAPSNVPSPSPASSATSAPAAPSAARLLRLIAIVETKAEIASIPAPRGLARPNERSFALGPPRPEVNVLIDAATGDGHALDPPDFLRGLPYPQPCDEPIRFRAEVMEAILRPQAFTVYLWAIGR